MKLATAAVAAALAMSACGLVEEIDPVAVCTEEADANGRDFRVVGSFATTVATLRGMTPDRGPDDWRELPGEAPAALCYLDGPVPHAPPDGAPFDRMVVAVAGGHAEMLIAGYRDEIAIRAP